jgi:hypothetical protein
VNLCGKKKSFLSEAMGFSSRYLIDAKKQNTNIADEPLQILAKELKTTSEYLRGETDDPGIKETPDPKIGGDDEMELREIFRTADEDERRTLLEMARLLKSRRQK